MRSYSYVLHVDSLHLGEAGKGSPSLGEQISANGGIVMAEFPSDVSCLLHTIHVHVCLYICRCVQQKHFC